MKIDFKKTLDGYKSKHGEFRLLSLPPMNYLMIDGCEGPGSAAFTAAIEAIYPVAYKLKFMSKLELGKDYVVPPLEATWWADDMSVFTSNFDQSRWDWSVMLMTPDWIDVEMVSLAKSEVGGKKSLSSIASLRLETYLENTCVQTLHLGAYSAEGPLLKEMHQSFIPSAGYAMAGKHHEIYFNDFRKVAPEKLRTILRQPVIKI